MVSGVTILLSLTVFMNMVQNIMPNTSDAVPLIGQSVCGIYVCDLPLSVPICLTDIDL